MLRWFNTGLVWLCVLASLIVFWLPLYSPWNYVPLIAALVAAFRLGTHAARRHAAEAAARPTRAYAIVSVLLGYPALTALFALAYRASSNLGSQVQEVSSTVSRCVTSFGQLFYFALVTGSTLGYGDMRPCDGAAKVVACIHVVVFWLWLAVAIDMLALRRRIRRPAENPTPYER